MEIARGTRAVPGSPCRGLYSFLTILYDYLKFLAPVHTYFSYRGRFLESQADIPRNTATAGGERDEQDIHEILGFDGVSGATGFDRRIRTSQAHAHRDHLRDCAGGFHPIETRNL